MSNRALYKFWSHSVQRFLSIGEHTKIFAFIYKISNMVDVLSVLKYMLANFQKYILFF